VPLINFTQSEENGGTSPRESGDLKRRGTSSLLAKEVDREGWHSKGYVGRDMLDPQRGIAEATETEGDKMKQKTKTEDSVELDGWLKHMPRSFRILYNFARDRNLIEASSKT
jgi:hypothetical protein